MLKCFFSNNGLPYKLKCKVYLLYIFPFALPKFQSLQTNQITFVAFFAMQWKKKLNFNGSEIIFDAQQRYQNNDDLTALTSSLVLKSPSWSLQGATFALMTSAFALEMSFHETQIGCRNPLQYNYKALFLVCAVIWGTVGASPWRSGLSHLWEVTHLVLWKTGQGLLFWTIFKVSFSLTPATYKGPNVSGANPPLLFF